MSNQLEKFINDNRDEFDSEELSKASWKKLQSKLSKKDNTVVIKLNRRWWIAAAGIIIVLYCSIVYFTITRLKTNEAVAVKTIALPPKEFTDAVDTTYTNQMYSFAFIIKVKLNELKENQRTHPGLYQQFLKDNNQLDSSFNFLKNQLVSNPNKEILLDAMIQNLQLKIELLNRQLQVIKQSKKTINEKKSI
jgi:hypothetical protein